MHNLAVFASGTGSNFEAIADACADGRLDARVALMVCDKPGAPVVEKAARSRRPVYAFTDKGNRIRRQRPLRRAPEQDPVLCREHQSFP